MAGSGTLLTGLFVGSILALAPAIATSGASPREDNLDYPKPSLMKNENYANGYRQEAFKIKKRKVWSNYAWAFAGNLAAYFILKLVDELNNILNIDFRKSTTIKKKTTTMNFNLRSFLLIIFSIFTFSCSMNTQGESPDQLFEKYKGSVVIVAIQYCYEILFDGITIYYSPGSQIDKKLFFNKNEALANLSFASGTGFIVSKNGEIITNNHVVNPKDDSYLNVLANLKSVFSDYLKLNIDNYSDTIQSINRDLINSSQFDDKTIENLNSKLIDLTKKKDDLFNSLNSLQSFNINSSHQKLVTFKIGVAYNDTHVSGLNDLQDCVIINESKDAKVDLALLQTKSKIFNVPPNEFFSLEDNNSISKRILAVIKRIFVGEKRNIQNPVKINDDVFMIGYNRGFTLANTRIGIKSQFTGGKISQESDGEKILYTIPTLEGSSGSPIIDKWGNLVGVNFAKIIDSQNFSLGIPVYEVKRFYLK